MSLKQKKSIFGLSQKMIIWFLLISLVPLVFVSLVSYQNAHQSLYSETENTLRLISQAKTTEIETYFKNILIDLRVQAESQTNREFLKALAKNRRESGLPVDRYVKSYHWAQLNDKYSSDIHSFLETYGHFDAYLIDDIGNILFSTRTEEDFGTNIFDGPYSQTHFAKACRGAYRSGKDTFSDFDYYNPSGRERIYGFVVSLILDNNGEKMGLFAIQIENEMMNKIMQLRSGIDKQIDLYIVGTDHLMRTDSTQSPHSTALIKTVETPQVDKWIKNHTEHHGNGLDSEFRHDAMDENAAMYVGPWGERVLGIHWGIEVQEVPFVVISEISEEEVFAAATTLRTVMIVVLLITGFIVLFISIFVARSISKPVLILSASAKKVADGDLDLKLKVRSKDEVGELTNAFNDMVQNLKRTTEESQKQNWHKTGLNELAIEMRGLTNIGTLGDRIITTLSTYLDAQVGALYVHQKSDTVHLVAAYSLVLRKGNQNEFKLGEGLVGQAVLERKPIVISDCPEDYIVVRSGLGESIPKNIIVYPLVHDEEVTGVIELASIRPFSVDALDFLESAGESISITLKTISAKEKTEHLLAQTQQQARELQQREEELRQTNEELESQSDALKSSQTRLQKQQEELRQTNEELEENKEETDRKNQELIRAQALIEEKAKDLEMSSKYKSEFLANMSHELRTPLNSILLLSQLLANKKDGSLSQDAIESASAIHSSGADLLNLINDVLDLSKVESGKMDLLLEEIRLTDLVASMERTFSVPIREKGLSFNIAIEDNLPATIRTDQRRVEQIIKNFLSNAVKFTSQGSITLKIGRPEPWHNEQSVSGTDIKSIQDMIAVSVVDTGIGIAQEKQKVVFEAFQQEDGSISRKFGGTGLGLSISREFSKILGGFIKMKSKSKKGSVFSLILPERRGNISSQIKPAELENGQPFNDASPEPSTEFSEKQDVPYTPSQIEDDRKSLEPSDRSILIIEDDLKFLKMLRDLSKENRFKTLVAEDGETGLQLAEFYQPSAIILDIGLPRMDGWTVMSRLKENSATRHIPVHFISGSDGKNEAMKMGAVDFLVKPVSLEKLDQVYQRLNQVIEKPVKDLLVVEDNTSEQQAIAKIIGSGDVRISIAESGEEALNQLKSGQFDCMVLDLGLPDMTGIELLSRIRATEVLNRLPVIIFTGRELTNEERGMLDESAESIIIKNADSVQKLLDETSLFLHRVEADLPDDQRNTLKMMHDKDTILINKKILLVDDDMRNVFSLKRILEEKEMTVVVGKTGKEAIERLKDDDEVDLVLMDIMMPEMDGYEATRQIRKMDRLKNLPIIALTAKAMKGDRKKCIESGANDYLSKPVNIDRLLSMLRVWLY